jgi:hypothetical protein
MFHRSLGKLADDDNGEVSTLNLHGPHCSTSSNTIKSISLTKNLESLPVLKFLIEID